MKFKGSNFQYHRESSGNSEWLKSGALRGRKKKKLQCRTAALENKDASLKVIRRKRGGGGEEEPSRKS